MLRTAGIGCVATLIFATAFGCTKASEPTPEEPLDAAAADPSSTPAEDPNGAPSEPEPREAEATDSDGAAKAEEYDEDMPDNEQRAGRPAPSGVNPADSEAEPINSGADDFAPEPDNSP